MITSNELGPTKYKKEVLSTASRVLLKAHYKSAAAQGIPVPFLLSYRCTVSSFPRLCADALFLASPRLCELLRSWAILTISLKALAPCSWQSIMIGALYLQRLGNQVMALGL